MIASSRTDLSHLGGGGITPQGYLLATKSTFARRTISEVEARVDGILREILRSSSVIKVVPDLGRVRRREQRVEVQIL